MISAATPGNSPAQTRRNKEVIFYDHIDDSADHHPALHSGGLSDGPVLTGGRDRFSGRRRAGGCAGRLCGRPLHGHGDFRNILMGILGSFVGEFVFGLFGIYATGSITSFIISVIGACICIWIGQKLSH